MRKVCALIVLAALLAFSACTVNELSGKEKSISLRKDIDGREISIQVSKGESFTRPMSAGPVTFNILPQMVFWTEDEDGNFIETLYITGADYKKVRHGGKGNLGEDFYRQCFPYWSMKAEAKGEELPSDEQPYPDSITSATPDDSYSLDTKLIEKDRPFAVYAEINQSSDDNETYSKENNDWAGQPSLIYRAVLTNAKPGRAVLMEIIGHGGAIDDEAKLYSSLSGIDSALKQVESITVSLGPKE